MKWLSFFFGVLSIAILACTGLTSSKDASLTITTNSVSEPGRVSEAGAHGNTFYPSIEIPYDPGETIIYWEIGQQESKK